MSSFRIIIASTVFFFFAWGSSLAQIDIRLSISNDTLQIGGPTKVSIQLATETGLEISSIRLGVMDSLGLVKYLFPQDSMISGEDIVPVDFEISNSGTWEIISTRQLKPTDGSFFTKEPDGSIRNEMELRIWDPGYFIVLLDQIEWKGSDGEKRIFFPDTRHSSLVYVEAPPKNAAEDDGLRPIKDILREKWHWLDYKWLYISIAAIVLIIFLITRPYRKTRKEKKPKEKPVIKRPAHEIALEKIASLRKAQYWQKGEVKRFQSELSYIFREYLENRYEIKALESTTREIVTDIQSYSLSQDDVAMMSNLLQVADLVKFAKAKPSENIHEKFLDQAEDFINRTRIAKEKQLNGT